MLKLAKKLGYEIVEERVLLPLGRFNCHDYGLSLKEGSRPRIYAKIGDEIILGDEIKCLTIQSILKTFKFRGKEFLIERETTGKGDEKALLLAFKNPGLSIDYKIKDEILKGSAKLIPGGGKILEEKILEIQEKINEAGEFSGIPCYADIFKNLNQELEDLVNKYFSLDSKGKRITLEGDFREIGKEMKGGELIVNGYVKFPGWYMEKGNLTINNNARRAGWYMKGGNLTINGDVEDAGREMKGGKIVINGSVNVAGLSQEGGKMRVNGGAESAGRGLGGGELIIKGDVEYAGYWMRGGILRVNGNARFAGEYMYDGNLIVSGDADHVGRKMKGGKLAVYGKVNRIGPVLGGEVFIDLDKNPGFKRKRIRPIQKFGDFN
jgi:formylmethanofuran dehydrogenase subunit C